MEKGYSIQYTVQYSSVASFETYIRTVFGISNPDTVPSQPVFLRYIVIAVCLTSYPCQCSMLATLEVRFSAIIDWLAIFPGLGHKNLPVASKD